MIKIANFLRNELPIRLAHRIQDLDQVPLLRDMTSVQLVKGIYLNSFEGLVDCQPILTRQDEANFAIFLKQKYELHSNVLIQMARGAFELRQAIRTHNHNSHNNNHKNNGSLFQGEEITIDEDDDDNNLPAFEQMEEIHSFLDRFYMSRIGIRVLAGQYLALRQVPLPGYIGMICLKTSPYEIVHQAAKDASQMCQRRYGFSPPVEVKGRLDLTFPYIPTYLHYMLLEVLKNALRATVENSLRNKTNRKDTPLPPVTVIISDGMENEDVVIKVADEGGGIARSQWKKVFSYLFTTADPNIQRDFIGDVDHCDKSPLAGLGFGLPISRSYARYFHGDLDLKSMEGYGTDAYIHLSRLDYPHAGFS